MRRLTETCWAPACVALVLFATATAAPADDYRKFTSSDGKELVAKILKADDKTVTLELASRKRFEVPVTRFSESDQGYIRQWIVTEAENRIPRLEVLVNSGKATEKTNVSLDDKREKFQFELKVTNQERGFDVRGAKLTLIALGKSAASTGRSTEFKVMSKSHFDELILPFGSQRTLRGEEVKYSYDNKGAAKFGYKYYGYVILVTNAKGKQIYAASTPDALSTYAEKIVGLKKNDLVNRELKKTGRATVGSSSL